MKRVTGLAGVTAAVAAAITLAAPGTASLAAASAPHNAALPTITVTMTGTSITVGGALESGGVRIVSTVTHERQGEPIFVRLDPGVTLKQFFKVLPLAAADPNNLDGIASIVVDVQVNRGATTTVQADLKAGQYVALDVAGNGRPPLIPFTIAAAAHPARLPAPAATIAAIEFGFRGPGTLHNGELVRFANHGFLVHMLVAARGASAAGAAKIAQLLRAGKDGQAQRLATGFATFAGPLSHDAAQQLVVRARPGWWVLACFMNTQDGREHTQLGMERVIHITG
jgi:hypothetical protein